jgi:hypothetical protein
MQQIVKKTGVPAFEFRAIGNYDIDQPLLRWAMQSEAFARYVNGRPVIFLRCPNRRASPTLEQKLAELAGAMDKSDGAPAPVVVIDHCNEGPPLIERYFDAFHAFAETTGMPLSNLVYASQNRLGARQQQNLIEARGLTRSYRWLSFDLHLHKLIDFQRAKPPVTERNTAREMTHTFLCMNRRPRAHRLVLLASLLQDPFRDLALVSYTWNKGEKALAGALDQAKKDYSCQLGELEQLAVTLMEQPIHIPEERPHSHEALLYDVPREAVERTAISIIPETHFTDGATRRVTEKSLKPLLYRHPFIMVGEYRSLALLEDWGFDIDFEGIDRSYDEIRDPGERMKAVLNVLRELACPPEFPVIRRVVTANRERVEYNRRHLLGKFRSVLYEEAEQNVRAWQGTASDWSAEFRGRS